MPNRVVANLSLEETEDLPAMQRSDPELRWVITYLETGVLPEDEKLARQVALTRSQYVIEDNVLYKLEGDGTVRVIPPMPLGSRIFQEAHGGRFGAHLSDVKVYSELRRHFWWNSMRGRYHPMEPSLPGVCYTQHRTEGSTSSHPDPSLRTLRSCWS